MTPEQKIKHKAIAIAYEWAKKSLPEINESNIDDVYEELVEEDMHWDALDEIRCCGVETGLTCPSSRNYDSEAVAAKMLDGSWVGWTYWYGGGKYGSPEKIEWMSEAYELNVTEKEVTTIERNFEKVEQYD